MAERKTRLVTDNIHESIPLSKLESMLIATPFFYRLHDVYQSSTVYLTFPCNRTKRYEHSLGTMHLAGEMFFSAVTNAESLVRDGLLAEAEEKIKKIINSISTTDFAKYCNITSIKPFFRPARHDLNAWAGFERRIRYEEIRDSALEHFFPSFSENSLIRKFTYQCVLEAVRLVALFHDVGHPPFSHILEDALLDLYYKCSSNNSYDAKKSEQLQSCLKPYVDSNERSINTILGAYKDYKADLHECIGVKFLCLALRSYFDRLCEMDNNDAGAATQVAYGICIAELALAILCEADNFSLSLHRIIDGVIDADRMDYIMRDSQNSGVDWGKIPYTRLINSCRMVRFEEFYLIAYPKKLINDIDDIIINRYKIFSRINYHHRSMKTGALLKKLVLALSEDYLTSDEPLCPAISELWMDLKNSTGWEIIDISRWNDSVLITHLYNTLIELNERKYSDEGCTDSESEILKYLEEFLLNQKHFYSIFKQQNDINQILESSVALFKENLSAIVRAENDKALLKKSLEGDTLDALHRISPSVLDRINHCDFAALNCIIPLSGEVCTVVQKVLKTFQDNNKIKSYLFYENTKRGKTGLPKAKSDEEQTEGCKVPNSEKARYIVLYDNKGKSFPYDVSNLYLQVVQLQKECLEFIVYAECVNSDVLRSNAIPEAIKTELSHFIIKSLNDFFGKNKES